MREAEAIYRSPLAAAGGLAVTGSGRQHARHAVNDRKLPSFAAVLVERGQGFLETAEGGRQPVEGPALFWLFPNRPHSYGPDEAGWDERWALFEGSFTRDFIRMRLIGERHPLVALRHLEEVVRLFARLHADLVDDSHLGQASAALALHGIVIATARASAAAGREGEGATGDLVETLRAGRCSLSTLPRWPPSTACRQPRCGGNSSPKRACRPRTSSFGRVWTMPSSCSPRQTRRSKPSQPWSA
ncbi:AraC family transcriptional regulator domain-containing protein [Rhizobium sp. N731]|nr:AraC family transcriptional regulator domain-containing protein [Rhizobium sp. N731]